MNHYLFSIAFALLCESATAIPGPDDCDLVPPSEPIDWSRVTGEWYHILNSPIPLDKIHHCYGSRGYVATKDGFKVVNIAYHLGKGVYHKVPFGFKLMPSGLYHGDETGESNFEAQIDEDTDFSSTELEEAHQHAMDFTDAQVSMYTDYENYVMYLTCMEKKYREIFVHGRNPKPSAEDIQRIHNKLISIGYDWNDMPFVLSACRTVDNLQEYVEE